MWRKAAGNARLLSAAIFPRIKAADSENTIAVTPPPSHKCIAFAPLAHSTHKKYKSSTQNSFPALNRNEFVVTNSFTAFDNYKFGATNSSTALKEHKFGATNSFSALDKYKFGAPNSLPAFNNNAFCVTNSFTAFKEHKFGATNTSAGLLARVSTIPKPIAAYAVRNKIAKKYRSFL